jgi:hypothetical protein
VVERRIGQCSTDGIHERQCRRAVHDRVLAHKSRTSTVEYDQLDGRVYPAIVEFIGRAVPHEAQKWSKVTWGGSRQSTDVAEWIVSCGAASDGERRFRSPCPPSSPQKTGKFVHTPPAVYM